MRNFGRTIYNFFVDLFRRTSLRRHSVMGHGAIIRKDSGEVVPFQLRGDVSNAAIDHAISNVAKSLYGPLAGGPFRKMLGALTHPTAVRNALADLVVDLIDAGAGAGTLVFQTAGDVEVATLTFSDPAFGAASGGTATANAITSDTDATGGTVAKARAFSSTPAEVFACAVGTSGSDINLSSLAVGAGDTVSMSSLTYTASP
jgi:hypothetical protein